MINLGDDVRFSAIMNFEHRDRPFVLDRKTMLVGTVTIFEYREKDKAAGMMDGMAQGRIVAVKVPGYYIFITPKGNLLGRGLDEDDMRISLRGMADFFKRMFIDARPNKYERSMDDYYPGMPGTWHPLDRDAWAKIKAERSAQRFSREGESNEGGDL